MAMTWGQSYDTVQRHLADQRARNGVWQPAQWGGDMGGGGVEQAAPGEAGGIGGWEGANAYEGLGGPMAGTASPAGGFFGLGGFPNSTTLAQAMDINPMAMRGLMSGIGLVNPGVSLGLMGLNAVGNTVNTMNNVGMLNDLGVSPGFGSILGGLFGFNNLAGTYAGALNKAMADMMPGFAGMSIAQMPGDFGMGDWGGWADIAADMGPTAENAPLGAVEQEPLGAPW